nr:MAG TPA: tail tape measure [Caudoviricetes sp.]DAV01399.1 MAG TPA: tail tape measure [Caudoviricetes sp.]
MADGPKLATAYYELIAAAPGAEKQITDIVLPPAKKAGEEAGAAAGDAIGAGGAAGGAKFGGEFGAGLKGAINPALIAAALGAAALGVGKALYDIGEEFDHMSDTIRVGTGATGAALEGLEKSAQKVATTVPTTFQDAGTTVADLNTRLGLTGTELETVASQVIAAGDLFGEKLDVSKLSTSFQAFNVPLDQTSEMMDRLFQVSQATGVGMNDLATETAKAAPTVQQLGFTFEDTVSLIGSLDKAGLSTEKTLSSMTQGLVNLAKGGEAPKDAFNRTVGEIQNFLAAGNEAAALTTAGKIFGTEGAPQFLSALKSGTFDLNTLQQSIGATGDTILKAQEDTLDGPEKFQIAVNKVKLALEPLATTVFDKVAEALTWATPKMEAFVAWAKENPALIQGIAIAVGVLAAALLVAAAAQWVMNSALLASPITWIIVGIGLIIAAIVLLIVKWDEVWPVLVGAWDAIVDAWNAAWGWIKGFFSGLWESITTFVTGIPGAISGFMAGAWDSISGFFSGLWESITTFVAGIPGAISGFLAGAWDTISAFFTWMLEGLVNFITGIPDMIMNGLGTIWDLLGQTWAAAWEAIKDILYWALVGILFVLIGIPQIAWKFLTELWNDLPAIWAAIWNGITTFFSNVWNGLVNMVKSIGSSAVNFAVSMWNAIPGIWSAIWNGITTFFSNMWNGLLSTVLGVGAAIVGFLVSIWNAIPGAWNAAWNELKSLVTSAMTGMWNGAKEIGSNMLDWFRNLPQNIINLFSNAGSWLVNAGKNIINGFLNGLKSAFTQVQDWVGGIGNWIAEHKGPRAYDLRLLVPAGGWIMDGLQTGLRGAMPELERTMRDITDGIRVGFEDPAARTAWKVSRGFNPDVELGAAAPSGVQPTINITNNYPQKQEDWKTRNDVAQGIALALS